jgi:hypothetical protein
MEEVKFTHSESFVDYIGESVYQNWGCPFCSQDLKIPIPFHLTNYKVQYEDVRRAFSRLVDEHEELKKKYEYAHKLVIEAGKELKP